MSLFGKLINTSTLEKYKELEDSEIDGKLSGKSPIGHTHDDRYYTESEIDTQLSALSTAINGITYNSSTETLYVPDLLGHYDSEHESLVFS